MKGLNFGCNQTTGDILKIAVSVFCARTFGRVVIRFYQLPDRNFHWKPGLQGPNPWTLCISSMWDHPLTTYGERKFWQKLENQQIWGKVNHLAYGGVNSYGRGLRIRGKAYLILRKKCFRMVYGSWYEIRVRIRGHPHLVATPPKFRRLFPYLEPW